MRVLRSRPREIKYMSNTTYQVKIKETGDIIEEYDATCVVPPDATVELDGHGNIAITMR